MAVNYQKLLNGATADGAGGGQKLIGLKQSYMVVGWGDFGGGAITIQWSPDNGVSWVTAKDCDGADLVMSEAGTIALENLAQGFELRAVLAGSTAPNVTVDVR